MNIQFDVKMVKTEFSLLDVDILEFLVDLIFFQSLIQPGPNFFINSWLCGRSTKSAKEIFCRNTIVESEL